MATQLSWKAKEATVGELAERAGVATSALRFYEREGLIKKPAHLGQPAPLQP